MGIARGVNLTWGPGQLISYNRRKGRACAFIWLVNFMMGKRCISLLTCFYFLLRLKKKKVGSEVSGEGRGFRNLRIEVK